MCGHAFDADKLGLPIFALDLGEAKSLDPGAWHLEENVELPTKSWFREFFRKHMIPFQEEEEGDAQAQV